MSPERIVAGGRANYLRSPAVKKRHEEIEQEVWEKYRKELQEASWLRRWRLHRAIRDEVVRACHQYDVKEAPPEALY